MASKVLELKRSRALLMKRNCVRMLAASTASRARKRGSAPPLGGPPAKTSFATRPSPLLLGTVKLPNREHMQMYTMMLDEP